jgi:hypothetical protein
MLSANDRRLGVASIALAGFLLTACSDIYYDRRDTVTFQAGDAEAVNRVTHAVDVWPQAAGYRNIVTSGEKVQRGVERYRTDKVTPPVGMDTSNISPQQQSTPAAAPTASP